MLYAVMVLGSGCRYQRCPEHSDGAVAELVDGAGTVRIFGVLGICESGASA